MRSRGRPPITTGERRYPNRLRELRERRGLSQQMCAAAAGMSGAYYGALERGDKRINADTAERLSAALGCVVGDLLAGARGISVPVIFAVAAAESEARPDGYDLLEPHQRLAAERLPAGEGHVAAEIFDDSANLDFAPGTIVFLRQMGPAPAELTVGARVLARFFLDPVASSGARATHEILYGILDRNIVGDLVLITRTENRLIPRNLLIQSAAPRAPGLAERVTTFSPRDTPVAYHPRPDDPAELLGIVVYAMGPV
jgi:transcriptional regulator with XRE-family HTH domain